ncbi:MAG: S1C family serine protease [Minisyncoccia bacterium]
MKKRISLVIVTALIMLIVTFNVVLAENNINLQNFLNLLKNIFKNNTTTLDLKSVENVFQNTPEYKSSCSCEDLVINTVEKTSPAVVSIIISKDVPIFEKYYIKPFNEENLPDEFKQFFEFEIPQYRQKGYEKKEIGGGTGFIISPNGLIATNKHVVSDKDAEYTVYLNDGRKFKAQVVALHPVDDLALIKVNANNLPYLTLGDSDKIKLGQTVIAIGNALGEFRNTVSVGVVSGLKRNITASDEYGNIERLEGMVQTDAAINRGNSGGPLINLKGEVIGINTAIVSGAENIGFAIPINKLKRMINELSTKGKIEVPFLGVRYILIDEEVKNKFKLPFDYGAYIYSNDPQKPAVIKDSPADKAGLKEKDIILEVDNQKVTLQNTLASMITSRKVGDTINLKVWRNGSIIFLKAVLAPLPTNLHD